MTDVCTRLVDGWPCRLKIISKAGIRGCIALHDDDHRTLLSTGALTPVELEAEAQDPRPGFAWISRADAINGCMLVREDGYMNDICVPEGSTMTWHARDWKSLDDIRKLDQNETDSLIVDELLALCLKDERVEINRLWNARVDVVKTRHPRDGQLYRWTVLDQIGGVHSDPLIRVIAFRAWDRRDCDWERPPAYVPHHAVMDSPRVILAPRKRKTSSSNPELHLHQLGCDDDECDGQCVR